MISEPSRHTQLLAWRSVYTPTVVTVLAALGLVAYGRIPQFADYHAFADQRILLGIPRGADVLSNVGFAIVGLWALAVWWPMRPFDGAQGRHAQTWNARTAYALFAAALVLTAAGSAFYHLAPDNDRLIWDRLPIVLGCAGLLAAVRAELRPDTRRGVYLLLLVAAAIISVFWWQWTEQRGADDLRPYLFLQALPLVLIPMWQAIYDAPRRERLAFGAAALLYIVAKLAELNDHEIHRALGFVSGHSLKHLLATVAAALIVAGGVARRTSSIGDW
jgi:predicted membrane channel-forming protein YqfA (hemolysin III family)